MSEADKIIESLKNSGRKVEEFYMSNKTSDKNVENIETVIKDCREHLKLYGEAFITADELDRIEKILAEREQDKKRIQELEEEKVKLKEYNKIVSDRIVEYKKNSIPKQIVRDKINEINKAYEDSKDENGESSYYYPDFIIRILQRFLGGDENSGNIKS